MFPLQSLCHWFVRNVNYMNIILPSYSLQISNYLVNKMSEHVQYLCLRIINVVFDNLATIVKCKSWLEYHFLEHFFHIFDTCIHRVGNRKNNLQLPSDTQVYSRVPSLTTMVNVNSYFFLFFLWMKLVQPWCFLEVSMGILLETYCCDAPTWCLSECTFFISETNLSNNSFNFSTSPCNVIPLTASEKFGFSWE